MNANVAYRRNAVNGSNPAQLVVLLYEQIIEDLRQALAAMEAGKIEERTAQINHALLVVCQLQGTLDMERGGEVARKLDRFYSYLQDSLLQAQFLVSPDILRQQIVNLLSVREAWLEVDRATASNATSGPRPLVTTAPNAASSETRSMDWTG